MNTKPCPDCAHTTHPGFYVGFTSTSVCPTCDGAKVVIVPEDFRWNTVLDGGHFELKPAHPYLTVEPKCETRPFTQEERANLCTGRLVAHQNKDGMWFGRLIKLAKDRVEMEILRTKPKKIQQCYSVLIFHPDRFLHWNGVPPTE